MKVKQWTNARRKLKKQFEKWGVVRCEVCNGDFSLGFAHRLKRRFVRDDAEIMTVALLCQKCHERIEFSGHEQMFDAINQIISNRR